MTATTIIVMPDESSRDTRAESWDIGASPSRAPRLAVRNQPQGLGLAPYEQDPDDNDQVSPGRDALEDDAIATLADEHMVHNSPSQGYAKMPLPSRNSSFSPPSSPVQTQSSSPAPSRRKRSSLLGLFTLKEPSTAALESFSNQQLKQAAAKGGRMTTVGMQGISSQKLPPTVPKVNSKWDGLPKSAKDPLKPSRNANRDSTISMASKRWSTNSVSQVSLGPSINGSSGEDGQSVPLAEAKPRSQSHTPNPAANTSTSLSCGKRLSSPPGQHSSIQPYASSPADSSESGNDLPIQRQGSHDQGRAHLGYFQTSSDSIVYTGHGNASADDRNDLGVHSTGRGAVPPPLGVSKIPTETAAGTEDSPESDSKYKFSNGAGKIAADSPQPLSPRTIHRFSSATWISSKSGQESHAEHSSSPQQSPKHPTCDASPWESAPTRETEASRVPLRELRNPRPPFDSETQAKVLPWETQTLDKGPDMPASPSKEPGKKKRISLGRRKYW